MTMTPIHMVDVMTVPANQSTTRRIARTKRRIRPVNTRPIGMRARPSPRSMAREERRENHPERAHSSGRTTSTMVTTATTVVSLIPPLFHMQGRMCARGLADLGVGYRLMFCRCLLHYHRSAATWEMPILGCALPWQPASLTIRTLTEGRTLRRYPLCVRAHGYSCR